MKVVKDQNRDIVSWPECGILTDRRLLPAGVEISSRN
jgi:hypothetical protein